MVDLLSTFGPNKTLSTLSLIDIRSYRHSRIDIHVIDIRAIDIKTLFQRKGMREREIELEREKNDERVRLRSIETERVRLRE